MNTSQVIALLNEMPITFAPAYALEPIAKPWEMYDPYGEILAFASYDEALAYRSNIITELSAANA